MENEELIENVEQTTEESEQEESKTFTQEEVLKLIQSESDKRVTQALNKQKREFEKQQKKEKTLSAMNDEQRALAERDERIAELEEMVRQNNIAVQKNEMTKVLSSRELPIELADWLPWTDDNAENLDMIDGFNDLFKKAVAKEVNKRLNGSTPVGSSKQTNYMTKAEFDKLPLSKQQQMYDENPERVKRILRG